MSDIPQLLAAIDGRLAELAAEITALERAKAALDRPRSDRPIVGRRHRRDDGTLACSLETSSPDVLTDVHRAGRRRRNTRASHVRV